MDLLVIRHGEAMDKEEWAKTEKSDDLRVLTSEGMEEMKEIARGLREQVKKLDVLATSSLVRAVQTAEIVADVYDIPVKKIAALSPDAEPKEFEKWCEDFEDVKRIAIVGHEPHLTTLITCLMTGDEDPIVELKKGGCCLLEFDSKIKEGEGVLRWLMTPGQLAKLGAS